MSGFGGGDDAARDSRGSAVRCVRTLPATIPERVGRGGTGGSSRCPDHRRRARLRVRATGRRMGNQACLTLQRFIAYSSEFGLCTEFCMDYAWGGLCIWFCLVYAYSFVLIMHGVLFG